MAIDLNFQRDPVATSNEKRFEASATHRADQQHTMACRASQQWKAFINHKELQRTPRGEADKIWSSAAARLSLLVPRFHPLRKRAERVVELEAHYASLTDDQLSETLNRYRETFRRQRESKSDTDHALAAIREQARRTTGLMAYPNQIMAADALYRQYMTEVATGEGKTLIASICAVMLGWRGQGCHMVTTNDYLAQRDAKELAAFYQACGLSVCAIDTEMPPLDRREAYDCDITYVTNKEVCADFLRDQLNLQDRSQLTDVLLDSYFKERSTSGRLVMRGRAAAIVDEVDSILMDEAATPLLISGGAPNSDSVEAYQKASQLCNHFDPEIHFTLNEPYREVRLTNKGHDVAAEVCNNIGGLFASPRRREELIVQALTARHFFNRNDHYVVENGKIIIIDESTGRQMPDRTWRDGLHQAVEAKEQLEINPPKATYARLSFQRYFRGYMHLCGMSGTTWEGRHEFQVIYKRATVRIPTHRPLRRQMHGLFVFRHSTDRWRAVVEKIIKLNQKGIPVLVGTHSVEASELISGLLTEKRLNHTLLNAVHNREEAQIIQQAGRKAAVTIATNMAGRGTDIRVDKEALALGGLYVLATNMHSSSRLDRQLMGRSARQGQPGQAACYVSLDDPVIYRYLPRILKTLARSLTRDQEADHFLRSILRYAQRRSESQAYAHRKHVLRQDEWLEDNVGFAPGGF